jgi:DNA-binding IclR family transcriptional regulator
LGVSAIAQRVGLSKATVHHLLGTLESRRFVVRDSMSAQYRLSWGLYELGAAVVRSVDLTRVARQYVDQLAIRTGESVLLGLLDGDSVLYLDRGEAPSGFRVVANAGRRCALHSTASGKVLLAFSQDPRVLQRILAHPLAKLTRTTITDPDQLRRELAKVRWQGYATCWQEAEANFCSLAVPVRDYSGAVIASLAIAGPSMGLNVHTVPKRLVLLRAAAEMIGAQVERTSIREDH